MSNIKLSLYNDNDDIEDSQLRSVLLFSEYAKEEDKEKYLMQRTVLSIIVQLKGECTHDTIRGILDKKFNMPMKSKDVAKHVKSLESDGLVRIQNSKIVAITEQKEGDDFFTKLNDDTEKLILNIYDRFLLLEGSNAAHKQPLIKNNIRRALSVYYKIAGFRFFGLKKNDEKYVNAVDQAIEGLDADDGKRLVTAIADTINKPTEFESVVINKWARAFIVTQLLQIDPTLTSFKQDRLRKKSFVLDTDVLLHAITTHAQYSVKYREMLTYLQRLGCEIIVPQEVIDDIKGHAEQALNLVHETGEEQVRAFDDYILSSTKFNNVFVVDYVNKVKSDPQYSDLQFDSYIGNIYFQRDNSILLRSIGSIIGLASLKNKLPEVKPVDPELKDQLSERILEKTIYSPKGAIRSDGFNRGVANDDSDLYLRISKCNEDANLNTLDPENKLLPEKYYFITQSTKIERSAKELGIYSRDIICHPEALITAVSELGDIPEREAEIINLFDNPFLVHTANDLWDRIEPIISEGHFIMQEETHLLRAKVNWKFDEWLTCKNNDEKVELARKYERQGLKFPQVVTNLADKLDKAHQVIDNKDEALAEKDAEIAKLKKALGKQRYLERLEHGNSGTKRNKRFKR